ncbi:MAG: DUF3006 domain-containing protein [Halobacteriales archaeon]
MITRRTLLAVALALLANRRPALAATPPDGRYLAVLDRFESGPDGARLAVLVLERAGESRGTLVVPWDRLPAGARRVDAVLSVVVDAGDLERARYLPEATARRAELARSRFDRLARDPDGDGGQPDHDGNAGRSDRDSRCGLEHLLRGRRRGAGPPPDRCRDR